MRDSLCQWGLLFAPITVELPQSQERGRFNTRVFHEHLAAPLPHEV